MDWRRRKPKGDLEAKLVSYCPNPDKLRAGTGTLSGVVTVALETKKGQVKLTLPSDIQAGAGQHLRHRQ